MENSKNISILLVLLPALVSLLGCERSEPGAQIDEARLEMTQNHQFRAMGSCAPEDCGVYDERRDCQCDEACTVYGDCCDNKVEVCDGESPAGCGWLESEAYYACGGVGTDPSGTNPIDCPPGLIENDPCGELNDIGCCDDNGDNWYCGEDGMMTLVVKDVCQ